MIRALLVDDEPLARKRLRRLLAEHPDVEVVAEAETGEQGVAVALDLRPDVVFLDVSMPGKGGVEALRQMHAVFPEGLRPAAIFTTAHEEHAVKAFELEGLDYLLKPVEKEGLDRALRRVRKALASRLGAPAPKAPGSDHDDEAAPPSRPAAPREATQHLAAQHAGKILRLAVDEIACVTVEDTLTWAYTPQGRFLVSLPLHEVEARLASPPFVQVSRSTILQLSWIDHLEPGPSGTWMAHVKAPVKLTVEVSRRRARVLREMLGF